MLVLLLIFSITSNVLHQCSAAGAVEVGTNLLLASYR